MDSAPGKRLSSWLGALTIPAIVALVGFGLLRDDSLGPGPQQPAEDEGSAPAVTGGPAQSAPEPDRTGLPPDVVPGSMRGTLLATEERNRAHILRLAIVGEGYACAELISADAVGDDARVWRARCVGGDTYWVTVDRFDRLGVDPAPYGDIDPSIVSPTPGEPQLRREQTLELEDNR